MANAVVGRVLLIPKGNYSASVSYNMLDIVRYDNKSWVCKQACTGQTPQEGDYWQLMASDGAEGGYCYIRYSVNADGTDFVAVPTEQTKYVGFYTGDSETAPTDKTLYAWSKYVGEDGTIGVDGVRGTRINQGTAITGVSTTPIPFPTGITDSLIGDEYQNTTTWNVYRCTTAGDAATALWIYVGNIKGADGLGSGDMLKSVYDTNNSGVVDMAEKLQTARTIELTGSVTGSAEFDGSGNVQINTTGGGASAWEDVEDKPFSTVGNGGLKVESDSLDVDFDNVQKPIANVTEVVTDIADTDYMLVGAKKTLWSTIKSKLKAYFDTLYNNYVLPTASTTTLGGVKVGTGLEMDGGTLNTTGSGGGTVINDPTTTPATPLETTNVLDDITSISNNTSSNQLAGALALKELNSNLQLIIDYIFALGGMPLIPTMTGYTTPSGEVTYSSEYTSTELFAWLAFDHDYSSFWSSKQSVSAASLVYEFANPVIISRFVFLPTSTDTGVAHTARIYVSDDGTTWAQVVSKALTAAQAKQEQIVNITPVSAKFIKYQPSGYTRKTSNFSYTSCTELQAYGFIVMNL